MVVAVSLKMGQLLDGNCPSTQRELGDFGLSSSASPRKDEGGVGELDGAMGCPRVLEGEALPALPLTPGKKLCARPGILASPY